MRNAYKTLVVKHKCRSSLGKPRHRWEDTNDMYHKEIRCEGVDRIKLVQDRVQWQGLVNTVMNLRAP
jgi:hypothetical protein